MGVFGWRGRGGRRERERYIGPGVVSFSCVGGKQNKQHTPPTLRHAPDATGGGYFGVVRLPESRHSTTLLIHHNDERARRRISLQVRAQLGDLRRIPDVSREDDARPGPHVEHLSGVVIHLVSVEPKAQQPRREFPRIVHFSLFTPLSLAYLHAATSTTELFMMFCASVSHDSARAASVLSVWGTFFHSFFFFKLREKKITSAQHNFFLELHFFTQKSCGNMILLDYVRYTRTQAGVDDTKHPTFSSSPLQPCIQSNTSTTTTPFHYSVGHLAETDDLHTMRHSGSFPPPSLNLSSDSTSVNKIGG